jgi:sugar/nucleoside kinase (ribokinase family)
VLVIGAANEEYVLEAPAEWEVGQKYTAESKSLLGGSGVNYARRLLSYDGCPAIPIAPIGNDVLGKQILDRFRKDLGKSRLDKQLYSALLEPVGARNFATVTRPAHIRGSSRRAGLV